MEHPRKEKLLLISFLAPLCGNQRNDSHDEEFGTLVPELI
jgi:hypothetical protein